MTKRQESQRSRKVDYATAFQTKTWIDRELAGSEFRDVRLNKRFRKLFEQLSEGTGESIPLVCQAPEITSSLLWSGTSQSWLTHYFGGGCRMKDRCFDQVLVTQPFYTATAYAIGARLAFIPATSRPAP